MQRSILIVLLQQWEIDFPNDHWLTQIDSLKLASVLPPKRSDPSKEYGKVAGIVGEATDENRGEAGIKASTKGFGSVQEVMLVKGKSEEFGSHQLEPLEQEDDSDEEEQGGSNCCIT